MVNVREEKGYRAEFNELLNAGRSHSFDKMHRKLINEFDAIQSGEDEERRSMMKRGINAFTSIFRR